MKKKMALALSLAMAATTLAPAAVSAADEQVTLTIMSSIQTEDEGKLESAIADAYMEQNPNVKIEFISVANNDLDAQITTMAASDDLPDAFYMNCALCLLHWIWELLLIPASIFLMNTKQMFYQKFLIMQL